MATSGLNDVLAALGLRGNNLSGEEGVGVETYALMEQLGRQAQAQQQEAAAAEAAVAEEKARLRLQTEDAKKRAGQLFQTDLRDPNNAIATLALEQDETFKRVMAMKTGIDAKKGTSFLDSPLDYISNAFTLPDEVAEYNALVDKYNLIGGRIDEINQNTQGTIATQHALETTQSAGLALHQLALTKAASGAQLTKLQIETAGYQIQGLQWLQGADKERLNLAITEYNILKNEEALAMQREERNSRLQDKADAEQLRLYYNLGRKSLGLPSLDRPSFMLQLRLDEKEANDFIKRGSSAEVGALHISDDPGSAMVALTKHRGVLPAGMEPVFEVLRLAGREVDAQFTGQKITPEVAAAAMNTKLIGQVDGKAKTRGFVTRMAVDMETPLTKKVANIYQIGDVATITTAAPALKETQLFTQILAPLVAAGVTAPSADQVVAAGITALSQKKISYPVLVTDLTAYYKAGVDANNKTRQFTAVGIPPQTAYNVTLNNGQVFFSEERVNLIDQTQVSGFLNKKLAAEVAKAHRIQLLTTPIYQVGGGTK